jgi:hypothetical protein
MYKLLTLYCSWSHIKKEPKGLDIGKSQIHYLFNYIIRPVTGVMTAYNKGNNKITELRTILQTKVKTHNYINRQNQSTTEKLWRKFQIFIFLIVHINVNTDVFCLIISYLRIKSYKVLNYNNCSTDWSFALSEILLKVALNTTKPTNTIISSHDYQKVN